MSVNYKNSTNLTQQNLLFYMEGCKTCNFFITTAHKSNMLKNFKMICIDGQKEKFKAQGLKKVPTLIIPSINKQFEGNDCLKWLEEMILLSSRNNNFKNEELIIPDIGFNNLHNVPNPPTNYNVPSPLFVPHTNLPPNLKNINHHLNNHTDMNQQLSQLSSQISQLSTQITQPTKSNEFEVPRTNVIKRTGLNPIQPPNSINTQDKNIKILGQNMNQSTHINQNNLPSVRPVNQLFGYLQNEMTGFSDGYAYISVDNPLPKSFLPPDKDMEIYTAPEGDKVDKKKQDQLMKLAEIERTKEHEQYKNTIDEINRRIAVGEHNLLPKWVGTNNNL